MSGDIDDASIPPEALRGLTDEQTERLTSVLDRYLAALELGDPQDLENLISEHPDLREPLQLYLGKLSELHHFSAGFSPHLAQLDQTPDAHAELGNGASQSMMAEERWDDASSNPLLANEQIGDVGQAVQTSQPGGKVSDDDTHNRLNDPTAAPPGRLPTSLLSGEVDPQTQPPQTRRLGDFELLRVLGRGGMGIVYEARQLSLKRRVALKLLPLISVLDSRQIARFKNEAQAAASLQHAHIVPVYAVGSYQGVHYYAMRLIEGKPLDSIIELLREQAAEASEIKARERSDSQMPWGAEVQLTPDHWRAPTDYRAVVTLGIHTARALAFAHNEGIVHRDIKPSNLIVDAQGKVWITDFGLARRVSDHTLTATGDVMGTLRYMSPEQARGETALVDGRSDVYSLAATLYELLALKPAITGDNSPAMIRAIETQTPVSLRHLRPDIPRDLVKVIEIAMSKDRDDRYLTAQRFADDLQRVLQGLPTLAKPPAALIRLAKWTARNQRITKIAAGVSLIVIAIIALSLALVQRSEAQAAADREKLRQSLQQCYVETVAELSGVYGAEHVRTQLVNRLLSNYRSFVSDMRRNSRAKTDLAMGLMHMGELYYELGQVAPSEQSLTEANQLYHGLVISSPRNLEFRRQLAASSDQLGRVLQLKGDIPAAVEAAREAVDGLTALTAAHPGSPVYMVDRARATNHLARLWADTGLTEKAQHALMETRELLESFLSGYENRSVSGEVVGDKDLAEITHDVKSALAATYNNLARFARESDDQAALGYYQRSIDLMLELAADSPSQTPSADLAVAYSNAGKTLAHSNRPQQAAESYQKAISIQWILTRIAPLNYIYQRDLAVSHNNLALVEFELRRIQSAEEHFREAIRLEEQLLSTRPTDSGLMHELGGTYNNLAMLLKSQADSPSVESAFQSAVRHQSQAVSLAPSILEYRQFLDRQLQNYSQWLEGLGRDEQALKLVRERLSLWPDDGEKLMAIARELGEVALKRLSPAAKNKSGNAYTAAVRDAISLAEKAGFSVQSSLTQEPFTSLAKLKGAID